MKLGAIISSHTNPALSGVAKFGAILAKRIGVPHAGIRNAAKHVQPESVILLSLKMRDMTDEEGSALQALLAAAKDKSAVFDVFFHTFDETALELDVIAASRLVFCGNTEIYHALSGFKQTVINAWCPYVVDIDRSLHESAFNILSFGMAHKIQVNYYTKLRDVLQTYVPEYSLWVSTAFHEKSRFGDFDTIVDELASIFQEHVQFLGFTSDETINYLMNKVQLFVAFFPKGVRANNTSVYVPMAKSRTLMTNLDAHSPSWFHHGKNVLDIHAVREEDLRLRTLQRIGRQAKKDVQQHASWEAFEKILHSYYS